MLAFYPVVNYIHRFTVSAALTEFSQCGKLIYFRRGKLAHLLSTDNNFQESFQYFIAILDHISPISSS